MKLFHKSHDGGKNSGVTGYWLIEWKAGFSIVVLRFSKGTREAFHSHAFNALTWWLKGSVTEAFPNTAETIKWRPSIFPKFTPKHNIHKIIADDVSWAISFRGPWDRTWQEQENGIQTTLTMVGWWSIKGLCKPASSGLRWVSSPARRRVGCS